MIGIAGDFYFSGDGKGKYSIELLFPDSADIPPGFRNQTKIVEFDKHRKKPSVDGEFLKNGALRYVKSLIKA
ncbi:MAG: hypothetical protein JXC85_01950 [Candidatus Aenigmarchaeota archaeon]|nr:hypothetical protein [Candidatus Aenigmarchaeota archaeon]